MSSRLVLLAWFLFLFSNAWADFVESPDGKYRVLITKSRYIIPSNCSYFFRKGQHASEIWLLDKENKIKILLVKPNFDCSDASNMIINPHNLQFSPDSKTLYFETSAWITTGAIHAVDLGTHHVRFVCSGSQLRVISYGQYKGDIIVNQHRYLFDNDNPIGSNDLDWVFTPKGEEVKVCDEADAAYCLAH